MEPPADPTALYALFARQRAEGFSAGATRDRLIQALLPDIYDLATEKEAMLGPEDEVSDLLHAGLIAVLEYLPTCAETTPEGLVEGCMVAAETGIQEALEAMVAAPGHEEIDAMSPGGPSTAQVQDWIAMLGQGRQPREMPEVSPGPDMPHDPPAPSDAPDDADDAPPA